MRIASIFLMGAILITRVDGAIAEDLSIGLDGLSQFGYDNTGPFALGDSVELFGPFDASGKMREI